MTITVRKENAPRTITEAASAAPAWPSFEEPFRAIRNMFGWDPFREMAPFTSLERATFAPAFEVKETNDAYVFKADLPGVKESDLEVHVTGNRLTVGGKRESEKEEKNERYYTYERTYGSFSRSFTLPAGVDVDKCNAHLESGVLTLTVPKKPEGQSKKIDVKAGNPPPAAKA